VALEKRVVVYAESNGEGHGIDAYLRARGFQVYAVENTVDLLDTLEHSRPDAAVLLGAGKIESLTHIIGACRTPSRSLIVVVWPGASSHEAIPLLEAGADHVSATDHPDWLAAELKAYLRRTAQEREAPVTLELGHLRIDLRERRVTVHGKEVHLTPTEFDILRTLAERPGTVLPSGEIMQQVMGTRLPEAQAQEQVKVYVHRLRQKLERDQRVPQFIRSVRGHGYMYAFERRAQDRPLTPDSAPSRNAEPT
jgi:DNA-binding response OmpR family regulator